MSLPELAHLLPRPGSPVELACGGVVLLDANTPVALHEGKLIYFCLLACKHTFEREPEKFLSGAIPHFDEL